MEDFARALPEAAGAGRCGPAQARASNKDRVCSCAVRMLDLGLFRVGSERYETDNHSYGLTTIKKTHMTIEGGVGEVRLPGQERQARPPG